MYSKKSIEIYYRNVIINYDTSVLNNQCQNVKKLVTNLHDKTEYDIQIRNLKQALNHQLTLKKFIQ